MSVLHDAVYDYVHLLCDCVFVCLCVCVLSFSRWYFLRSHMVIRGKFDLCVSGVEF